MRLLMGESTQSDDLVSHWVHWLLQKVPAFFVLLLYQMLPMGMSSCSAYEAESPKSIVPPTVTLCALHVLVSGKAPPWSSLEVLMELCLLLFFCPSQVTQFYT